MKKITTFLMMLLMVTFSYGQSLPLDFEVAEDDAFNAFNGATANVVTDPTDNTNSVLELVSNGADFDGATITLDTYIDLSDDSNNTITMQFWTTDATSRTHLLKLEGSSTGATEKYFETNVSGWQTISVDFGPDLGNDYPTLTIFADSGVGNTATGTYYIDDIDGPNGAVIPVDPIPSTPAPVPTAADEDTYSIYNDTNNYSTVFPVSYSFGTLSGEPDLDDSDTDNKALKFNFGIAGWGQGEGGPDDVSSYDFVSFYYWAGANLINGFRFVMISNDGTVSEYVYQVGTQTTLVKEQWTRVEIPMSYFTDLGFANSALFQWKVSPYEDSVDNSGIVYIDNILLTKAALTNDSFSRAEFKAYPNPTQDVWNIKTTENIQSIQVFNITGRLVKDMKVNGSGAVINTSGLSKGVYLAKISNEFDQTKTIKLIKE
ncbi:T9SS type A sorting domain-containing protein [Psychroflexus sp. CAK57W]|uniref:T9SS type A sorting domain-containing protein n=1 Tax=Psychroflexus curvus TaxID=2873595 RepID=UPI001CC9C745|nr:T9SS type A sorting domain-containing protein [Psychroflexus curvus]MBZ9787266.1 T9SS type A sorting domain-containing protein [Psychroflexus curvus]